MLFAALPAQALPVVMSRIEQHPPHDTLEACAIADGEFDWKQHIHHVAARVFTYYAPLSKLNRANFKSFSYLNSFVNEDRDDHLNVIELYVMHTEEPNAFSIPGNSKEGLASRIIITEGLLLQLTHESELAFVLAHEFAHLRLSHFTPEIPTALLSNAQRAEMLQLQRSWEIEADSAAVRLLEATGFTATRALKLFSHLSLHQDHGHKLSSHPSLKSRIIQAKASPSPFL